jgi:hypothetical protein
MNKYLEKIAKFGNVGAKVNKLFDHPRSGAWAGAGIGATTMGGLGYGEAKFQQKYGTAEQKKNTKPLVVGAISGALGGFYGARIGHAIGSHRKVIRDSNDYFKNSNFGGQGGSGGYTSRNSGSIHEIHKDLNIKTPLKTKTEFKSHIRKQRSAFHPDRYTPGTPEYNQATETMKKINTAHDKFMAHPEGFEKLASNAYLNRIFSA